MNKSDQHVSNFIAKLLEAIPELRPLYNEHLADCDRLMPYVFLNSLMHHVIDLYSSWKLDPRKESDLSLCKRILDVLEQYYASSIESVRELIWLSFIEDIWVAADSAPGLLNLYGPKMHADLKEYLSDMTEDRG